MLAGSKLGPSTARRAAQASPSRPTLRRKDRHRADWHNLLEIYVYRIRDGLSIRLTHDKWEDGGPFWVGPVRPQSAGDGER